MWLQWSCLIAALLFFTSNVGAEQEPKIIASVLLAPFDVKEESELLKPVQSQEAKTELSIVEGGAKKEKKENYCLKIKTSVPSAKPRFQQTMLFLPEEKQDWRGFDRIEIWAKGDGLATEPWGGEFSLVIIDKDGEVWQWTIWWDRQQEKWKKLSIPLVAPPAEKPVQQNPWPSPGEKPKQFFCIPPWEKVQNGKLDLEKIEQVWFKTLTTEDWCSRGYEDFTLYLDELALVKIDVKTK
jgi:hypothetical protein